MGDVKFPIVVPVNVVVVIAIVTGVVKNESLAFSHLTTVPVFPLKVRLAGFVPMHIV